MTTITTKINERSKAGKAFKAMLDYFSQEHKAVEIIETENYNPDFVKMVKNAQKEKKGRVVNPNNIWEGIK